MAVGSCWNSCQICMYERNFSVLKWHHYFADWRVLTDSHLHEWIALNLWTLPLAEYTKKWFIIIMTTISRRGYPNAMICTLHCKNSIRDVLFQRNFIRIWLSCCTKREWQLGKVYSISWNYQKSNIQQHSTFTRYIFL